MTDHHITIHQLIADRNAERGVGARRYSDVPTYRKRWVAVVLFLVFIPAMIAIVLSGPIWQNDGGRAEAWSDTQRYQAAIGGAVFMMIGLAQLLAVSG
ncbi:MAG: hypothetical protein AB8G26_03905 [Ilumatobacter sp.]